MATTFISFIYRPTSSSLDTTELLEKEYQKIYKPLGKFLFTHPDFHFTFYFPGNRIQFYKKKRPEFLTLLKQLIERNQVEVLGGAFYDPLMPLLFTADRNGQLDLLSAEIRQSIGKRPRGCSHSRIRRRQRPCCSPGRGSVRFCGSFLYLLIRWTKEFYHPSPKGAMRKNEKL